MSSAKESFSPEMIKIFKIFGLGSLLFVLLLSFFNEKRANNSGDEKPLMRITDADRLFFKNLRAVHYDLEGRDDAKINIYRHGKRIKDPSIPHLNLSILINRVKDEAYIFVEPQPDELPLRLQWKNLTNGEEGALSFYGGDTFAHLEFVSKLNSLLEENIQFTMAVEESWKPILEDVEVVKTTIKDYFRLTNNPN
ncbi:hypothetical protein [Cecembia lonarensis]|uniref:Uncharacterized protein n=1 Tax=Cecembia lonarensis (strain CCUG 58316 / KCTC 22772 / LW9) TaxID=1225176 RepID=K1LUU3_CECL9|nr:hypothetical protein [Cecembia lonarensis]EKB47919.1 hypothetical protein B879_03476 [Cecembia lonarensis LW9]